jgi:hypothetical protein
MRSPIRVEMESSYLLQLAGPVSSTSVLAPGELGVVGSDLARRLRRAPLRPRTWAGVA